VISLHDLRLKDCRSSQRPRATAGCQRVRDAAHPGDSVASRVQTSSAASGGQPSSCFLWPIIVTSDGLQLKLEESATSSLRAQNLEKEVKEKALLIGKLRHEGMLGCFTSTLDSFAN
jgi:hypothetical protein